MRKKSWTIENLIEAVKTSKSIKQVLDKLKLIPAGGNYDQIKKYIKINSLNTSHFTGSSWNKGMTGRYLPYISLESILNNRVPFQSFKLKQRLFIEEIKQPKCEECGWAKKSEDGRIPVELDHINGDKSDNRLENLRILCPNCHSLKLTHRGRNKKIARVA